MLALLATLAGALALFRLLQTLHTGITNPLNHLPGPFLAKYTPLILQYHILTGNRMHHVHSLHRLYGPIVLISPLEVSVSDPEAYARIHKISSSSSSSSSSDSSSSTLLLFKKSTWYDSMKGGPVAGLFAERDPARHAARRKLLSRNFSNSTLLRSWEGRVKETVRKAVVRIKEDCCCRAAGVEGQGQQGQGQADLLKWWTLMAQDVIAQLCFGESFRMVEKGEQTPYITAIQRALVYLTLVYQLPWLAPIMPVLSCLSSSIASISSSIFIVFGESQGAVRRMRESEDPDTIRLSLFSEMFALADSSSSSSSSGAAAASDGERREERKNGGGGGGGGGGGEAATGNMITDSTISSEATNFIVAGSDSTAVTMTYVVYAVLSSSPSSLQSDLEAEVASLSPALPLHELADSSRAPLLNSVIRETLRLYGAIPSALPRVVPDGGVTFCRRGSGEGGYFLPAGTVVSTQAFSLHRDEAIWGPDAERFDGYRFLDDNKITPTQKLSFGPFGAGSRICIGIHLAMMELRLATAMFFRECAGARLAPGMTDEDMFQEERFFVAPKGHRCNIVLPRS